MTPGAICWAVCDAAICWFVPPLARSRFITDTKSRVEGCNSCTPGGHSLQSAICNLYSAICNLAVRAIRLPCNLQSAICNLQSATCNLQKSSEVGTRVATCQSTNLSRTARLPPPPAFLRGPSAVRSVLSDVFMRRQPRGSLAIAPKHLSELCSATDIRSPFRAVCP